MRVYDDKIVLKYDNSISLLEGIRGYHRFFEGISDFSPIRISFSGADPNRVMEIDYKGVEDGRYISFLGGQFEVESGWLCMTTNSISQGSIAIFNLYDFLTVQVRDFNRDIFLSNVENIKLNKFRDDSYKKIKDLYNLLEVVLDGVNYTTLDREGSITARALRDMWKDTKRDITGDLTITEINRVKNFLSFRLYLYYEIVSNLKDLFIKVVNHSDRTFNKGSVEIQKDEHNIIFSSYDYETPDELEEILSTRTSYIAEMQRLKEAEQAGVINSTRYVQEVGDIMKYIGNKEQFSKVRWLFDSSKGRGTEYLGFDLKNKSSIMYYNIQDVLRASKSDDYIEVYSSLCNDDKTAKSLLKKTSVSDIINKGFLTQVLKQNLHISLSGIEERPSRDILDVNIQLSDSLKANTSFIRLLKKVLEIV